MSTVDDERFIEQLEPFGEIARTKYYEDVAAGPVEPWELVHPAVKLNWSKVADAVLNEYDPEWTNRKAGM